MTLLGGSHLLNAFECQGGVGQHPKQIDNLEDVGKVLGNLTAKRRSGARSHQYWHMSNGYCLPVDGQAMNKVGQRLTEEEGLYQGCYQALRVGVHWDTQVAPPHRHCVTQVFVSAMPVAYVSNTTSTSWGPIATLVLKASYDATLLAAHCLALERGTRVRVYLTKLGAGAFGNRDSWVCSAITHALEKHKDAPLDVFLVHYGPPNMPTPSMYKTKVRRPSRSVTSRSDAVIDKGLHPEEKVDVGGDQ